jgi:hypothetical protein
VSQNEVLIWNAARPWTKEQIKVSCFRGLIKTQETIESLPGSKISLELDALRLSLNIFLDAAYDLFSSINMLKGESEKPDFYDRTRRTELERLELHIQRGVFSAAAAAMALVYHSRQFNTRYPVESYQERIDENFAKDPLHRFIQKFRDFMVHVRSVESSRLVTWDKQGKSVFFILSAKQLKQYHKWDAPSKSYIESHPKGINVEQLFREYLKKIKLFHDWFRSEVWEKNAQDLKEYFACKKVYNAVNAGSMWSLLIKQAFAQKKINPYMYLDKYLSGNEIQEILSLPFRSKEQVDRVIELVDECGVCDEELRKATYALFGVAP